MKVCRKARTSKSSEEVQFRSAQREIYGKKKMAPNQKGQRIGILNFKPGNRKGTDSSVRKGKKRSGKRGKKNNPGETQDRQDVRQGKKSGSGGRKRPCKCRWGKAED